jgi:hypothetical protein
MVGFVITVSTVTGFVRITNTIIITGDSCTELIGWFTNIFRRTEVLSFGTTSKGSNTNITWFIFEFTT